MLSPSEVSWMTALVAASFDQSLPLYHPTTTQNASGNTVETYPSTPSLLLACTVTKPSDTLLQLYADVIAGKRAEVLNFLPTPDVHEGDRIVKDGLNWRVQPVDPPGSYRFTSSALIVTIS